MFAGYDFRMCCLSEAMKLRSDSICCTAFVDSGHPWIPGTHGFPPERWINTAIVGTADWSRRRKWSVGSMDGVAFSSLSIHSSECTVLQLCNMGKIRTKEGTNTDGPPWVRDLDPWTKPGSVDKP